ncbi:MAG: TonB-dependent receptor [Armatimonadetes bacterium]|nr:TonB-dependent receptor [Armatimonadota bacterium]
MRSLLTLALALVATAGFARTVRFAVAGQDGTHVAGEVTVQDVAGRQLLLRTGKDGWTPAVDLKLMKVVKAVGESVVLKPNSTKLLAQEPPITEIKVRVTATRLKRSAQPTAVGTVRDKSEISKFVNTTSGDTRALTKGQPGVTEDSAGQQHVRGAHTDITYVTDGVPLPDTLSGRSGSVIVPSTIETLELLTGGFAPEFGGQTAAVLNVTTVPARKNSTEGTVQGGSYGTLNNTVTVAGPIGNKWNMVLNLATTASNSFQEPSQPDRQAAHNQGYTQSAFMKLGYRATPRDRLTVTVSHSPDGFQVGNRTGLGEQYASAGEGYGFQGLRNADGTRPDAMDPNLLGAGPLVLKSQQDAGMDIRVTEVTTFSTLNWQHDVGNGSQLQLAVTFLHSGQDVDNSNPAVDLLNLPVDNSIEFNPTSRRNAHHVQWVGSYSGRAQAHRWKVGFTLDQQSGNESYQITPDSQLALDELAAIDPGLAPAGHATGAKDVNGNPVYVATSNVTPTLAVNRSSRYSALYAQDTFSTGRFSANYGLRLDTYHQTESLQAGAVDATLLSPRVNLQYRLNGRSTLKASYDKLFNTPPLAQGALVGVGLKPEKVSQYDLSLDTKLGRGQSLTVAYYYKKIQDQVDVGLLIPGSQIGLYSGVNFDEGAVHGLEVSYDVAAMKGFDGYLNLSHSAAKPGGFDNTGAPAPEFNDHDQRDTIGAGIAHTWKNGATAAFTYTFGSGLASSIVPPSINRTPRSQVDLRMATSNQTLWGHGSIGLDVTNLFDSRKVINFQSAFSGTRFQEGRRILLSANFTF